MPRYTANDPYAKVKVLMDWTPMGRTQWKVVVAYAYVYRWARALDDYRTNGATYPYVLMHRDEEGGECNTVCVYGVALPGGDHRCPVCGVETPEEIRFMANMLLIANENEITENSLLPSVHFYNTSPQISSIKHPQVLPKK